MKLVSCKLKQRKIQCATFNKVDIFKEFLNVITLITLNFQSTTLIDAVKFAQLPIYL